MTRSLRVLVLGHDAGRQGAQIMLLDVLVWLREHTDFDLELVLHHDGPLRDSYAEILPACVANPFHGSPATMARILRRVMSPSRLDEFASLNLRRRLRRDPPDVVWANSVASWRVMELVVPQSVPRILHVHELDCAIAAVGPRPCELRRFAEHFIAASNAVKANLESSHAIPGREITVIHECVPSVATHRSDVAVGLVNEPFVIVGCGVASHRKGFDLLPGLVKRLAASTDMPRFEFRWIGRVPDGDREGLDRELRALGLEDRVALVGEVENPARVMSQAHVFAMTSREDPFPLVCLEAAGCGLPVICFEDSGGAPELVEDDAGVVVPFLDLDAMSKAVLKLARDPELRIKMGARARRKVANRYTVDIQAPKIEDLIRHLGAPHG